MKLIDILVRELPGMGGWPEGCEDILQSAVDNEIYVDGIGNFSSGMYLSGRAEDAGYAKVSRNQYEAALAAYKVPVWDGEGLPPVGVRVQYTCKKFNPHRPATEEGLWYEGTVIAYHDGYVWTSDNGIRPLHNTNFRPIRTEAERKREEAVIAMAKSPKPCGLAIAGICFEIYDAIAAGKIPGVKLDDSTN